MLWSIHYDKLQLFCLAPFRNFHFHHDHLDASGWRNTVERQSVVALSSTMQSNVCEMLAVMIYFARCTSFCLCTSMAVMQMHLSLVQPLSSDFVVHHSNFVLCAYQLLCFFVFHFHFLVFGEVDAFSAVFTLRQCIPTYSRKTASFSAVNALSSLCRAFATFMPMAALSSLSPMCQPVCGSCSAERFSLFPLLSSQVAHLEGLTLLPLISSGLSSLLQSYIN